MEKADIIIPVYKPDGKFLTLIEKLGKQSVLPNRIIIMNTEQKYYDRLIYGTSFQKEHRDMVVKHLSRREFDHGRTRNRGVQYSDTDFFIMMTQDAVPADEYLVERLLEQLGNENVAVAYARQLADGDSSEIEKYTRNFNYPEQSKIKTKADLETLGIKTFFCSNVCAAYNRKIFDELGGFVKHTIFNEDMIYAARAVEAGYGIAYTAEARVVHSHDYSNREQFQRNFDLGVSQAQHPEVFAAYPSESEGIRLVRQLIRHLRESGHRSQIPHVMMQSGARYIGYQLGRHYRALPDKMVVRMSNNKEYWG
ncbi:MAG: glycosyltransferase family 2 protein [Lachnospiraceae bacterium]|nr:glycosyltransferase family 2 protein [Lachnospiraceae bacterium]MCI9012401.1 glycosyltransferase family 2 protein [Lachnospiraceae bacterium]